MLNMLEFATVWQCVNSNWVADNQARLSPKNQNYESELLCTEFTTEQRFCYLQTYHGTVTIMLGQDNDSDRETILAETCTVGLATNQHGVAVGNDQP